jgi:hypothetical protein
MIMDELNVIEAPVSDFTSGVVAGVGIGLGIVGVALAVAALC